MTGTLSRSILTALDGREQICSCSSRYLPNSRKPRGRKRRAEKRSQLAPTESRVKNNVEETCPSPSTLFTCSLQRNGQVREGKERLFASQADLILHEIPSSKLYSRQTDPTGCLRLCCSFIINHIPPFYPAKPCLLHS